MYSYIGAYPSLPSRALSSSDCYRWGLWLRWSLFLLVQEEAISCNHWWDSWGFSPGAVRVKAPGVINTEDMDNGCTYGEAVPGSLVFDVWSEAWNVTPGARVQRTGPSSQKLRHSLSRGNQGQGYSGQRCSGVWLFVFQRGKFFPCVSSWTYTCMIYQDLGQRPYAEAYCGLW